MVPVNSRGNGLRPRQSPDGEPLFLQRGLVHNGGDADLLPFRAARVTAETARTWLAEHAPDLAVIDQGRSTATVAEAAAALGVEPGRIAKTLALRLGGRVVLLIARGDARLDNGKCKTAFGARPRMLDAAEALALTGHPVGGVCPFGLATALPVYLDRSIRAFDPVFPAAGSLTSSVRVSPDRLFELVGTDWVDLCRLP